MEASVLEPGAVKDELSREVAYFCRPYS